VGVKAGVALPSGSDPGASVCTAGSCGTEVDDPETWQPSSAVVMNIMIRIIHTYLIVPPSNEHTLSGRFLLEKVPTRSRAYFVIDTELLYSVYEIGDQKVTLALYFKGKLI
jgi:hypothetical protein